MTRLSSMLLAAIVFVSLAALARPAAAIEYPWCAQYSGRRMAAEAAIAAS